MRVQARMEKSASAKLVLESEFGHTSRAQAILCIGNYGGMKLVTRCARQ